MAQSIETKIDRFGGGMTSDTREKSGDKFAFSFHLDLLDNKRSLKPKKTYTIVTDATAKIAKTLFIKNVTSGFRLYGLGQDSAGQKTEIFKSSLPVSSWASVDVSTTGLPDNRVFFEYKDEVYFWQNGTVLSKMNLVTSPNITEAVTTLSTAYTDVAQPVHHPADDIAYFFYDNKVSKLNNTSPTKDILTLPSNLKIVGGAPYGNYLAILASPIQAGTASSILYIWDRDSSLTTVTAKIDLGFGDAVHIGNDNNGIFITQVINSNSAFGVGNNEALAIKYYNGFITEKRIGVDKNNEYFKNIKLRDIANNLPPANSISTDNVFHFPAQIITRKDAVTYNVIFSAKMTNGEVVITANQNITGLSAGKFITGIYELNGFWYITHSDTKLLQTEPSSNYQQGVIETLIYDSGDSARIKDFLGVTVMTAPLPASGTVKLFYRLDNETAWSQIFTHTVTGSISHSSTQLEGSGDTLPQFKEIQFRIEGTIGAEITGLKFRSKALPESYE